MPFYSSEPDVCAACGSMMSMELRKVEINSKSKEAWICDECGHAHLKSLVFVEYMDTCSPDYLQDHHTRDGELMEGLYHHGQTPQEAAVELKHGFANNDKLPESITDQELLEACTEACKWVDFRPFDKDGNQVDKPKDEADQEIWDAVMARCDTQSWFLLTWETDDE